MDMIGRLEDYYFCGCRFLEVENLRCLVRDRYGTIHVGIIFRPTYLSLFPQRGGWHCEGRVKFPWRQVSNKKTRLFFLGDIFTTHAQFYRDYIIKPLISMIPSLNNHLFLMESVRNPLFFVTLPETNISPENRPLEKEIPIGNHHFQGLLC